MAREGADITIADVSVEGANKVAEEVKALGRKAIVTKTDVTKAPSVEEMASATVAAFGKVDILVNNAGATWGAPAEDHPFDAWQKVVNVNLNGMFLITQAIGKRSMIPRRCGRIINNASVAGLAATDPRIMRGIAYHATKGGVVNFTRALAAEWGEYGITVNAICPGFFPSKMSKGVLDTAARYIIDHTPLRRLGDESDLKGLVALLASEASRHITGQAIAVDGGASII